MLYVERVSSEGHNVGSEISGRRVWGQKPGQLGNLHHRKYEGYVCLGRTKSWQ